MLSGKIPRAPNIQLYALNLHVRFEKIQLIFRTFYYQLHLKLQMQTKHLYFLLMYQNSKRYKILN